MGISSSVRNQIPSAILNLGAIYICWLGIDQYLTHLQINPTHELGILAEIVTAAYLTFGLLLIAISVWASFRQRPLLPTVVLVWLTALKGTFAAGVYSISANTQFEVALGVGLSVIPALMTWIIARLYRLIVREPID